MCIMNEECLRRFSQSHNQQNAFKYIAKQEIMKITNNEENSLNKFICHQNGLENFWLSMVSKSSICNNNEFLYTDTQTMLSQCICLPGRQCVNLSSEDELFLALQIVILIFLLMVVILLIIMIVQETKNFYSTKLTERTSHFFSLKLIN